jgi:hypothetical protein
MNNKLKASTLYLYSATALTISLGSLTLISKSIGIIQALALFLIMFALLIIISLLAVALYVFNDARKMAKKKIHIEYNLSGSTHF